LEIFEDITIDHESVGKRMLSFIKRIGGEANLGANKIFVPVLINAKHWVLIQGDKSLPMECKDGQKR
jgi:hypothetical protein